MNVWNITTINWCAGLLSNDAAPLHEGGANAAQARYRVNTVLSMHMSNFNFGVIIFLIVIDED